MNEVLKILFEINYKSIAEYYVVIKIKQNM